MKQTLTFLLFTLSLFTFQSQTAEEIIQKNLDNSGGYNNWNLLNSTILKGKVTLGLKDVYPITIYQKRPNLTLSAIDLKGKMMVLEAYDGEKAYQNNFQTGKREIIANYKPDNFDSDLLNYKSKGFTVKLLGKEKVQKQDCFKVELTKNTEKTVYFFSTKDYSLLKEQNGKEFLLYSNFKKVDKLSFPFTIESINSLQETEFLLTISDIQLNKVIPEKVFKY